MTTKETLLAEARELRDKLYGDSLLNFPERVPEFAVAFALSQLRAAKESGHLGHKKDCTISQQRRTRVDIPIAGGGWKHEWRQLPCSCGFTERFGEL